jgi:hypothetical protein
MLLRTITVYSKQESHKTRYESILLKCTTVHIFVYSYDDHEDVGIRLLFNARTYIPIYTASHTTEMKYSSARL